MQVTAISAIITAILKTIPEDAMKKAVETLLLRLEVLVKDSENKIDDAIILPLIEALRKQMGL